MRRIPFILSALLLSLSAWAQELMLQGHIVDAKTGESLPYVSIYAGEGKGTLSYQGKHPIDYHKFVLEQMHEIDRMPNMNQTKFINHFEQRVIVPIKNNPEMLYKNFWKK